MIACQFVDLVEDEASKGSSRLEVKVSIHVPLPESEWLRRLAIFCFARVVGEKMLVSQFDCTLVEADKFKGSFRIGALIVGCSATFKSGLFWVVL